MNLPRDIVPLSEILLDMGEVTAWKQKENRKRGEKEKKKGLFILDLGSSFLMGIPMPKLTDPTAEELLLIYHERWTSIFGMPRKVHMDPAGAHVSFEMLDQMQTDGSEPRTSAGEAHWQQGAIERAIKGFDTRLKMVLDAKAPENEA